MSSLLVSRVLEFAVVSSRGTGTSFVNDFANFSKVSVDAFGSILGAPGIGVEVTAFGLLCLFFGVTGIAVLCSGEGLEELRCFWSFFSSSLLEVPGSGGSLRFRPWSLLSSFPDARGL